MNNEGRIYSNREGGVSTLDNLFNDIGDPTESFLHKITGGLPNEPPLLDELEISGRNILRKTSLIANPFIKIDKEIIQDCDLIGPFLFYILFGIILLVSGKIHFGYIYATALFGWLFLFFLLNMLGEYSLDGYKTASIMGYSATPLLIPAIFSVFFSLKNVFGLLISLLCALWCSLCATKYFVEILSISEKNFLVGYPLLLFYFFFVLIVFF